jgi:homopolymeric O-antigen transport system permease protein
MSTVSAPDTRPVYRGRRRGYGHSARYLVTHLDLLLRVTWSDLGRRYAGSFLGVGWVIIAPAVLFSLYAGIYLFVFKVKVPGLSGWNYVLFIFSGLVPYLMTAEALSSGVGSVVVNRSVLNSTVFPIDLAPVKAVFAAQGSMIVGMLVTIVGVVALGRASWTLVLVPVVWVLQVMALLGVTWILSLINVVVRDLQNLVGLLLVVLMIASPIAYSAAMVPPSLKAVLFLNPLAYFVITYQHILVLGTLPGTTTLVLLAGISIFLFVLGGWFFAKAKAVMVDYV